MISIIMRTHNSEAFLEEAIESVLSQTYSGWELIVSDDASTDRTITIASGYARRDGRIRLIPGEHLGAAENGNRCLRHARHPWIAVLDSDDVALPDRLSLSLDAAQAHPEVVLWGGRAILIDRYGKRLRQAVVGPRSHEEYEQHMVSGRVIYVMSPTAMFRRDLALELGGYDHAMDGAEDVELMTRLAERGPVMTLDHELALYRIHGASTSSTLFNKQQNVFDFLDLRAKLRLSGEDITMAEYRQRLREQPTRQRIQQTARSIGRAQYRAAVVNLAERRPFRAAGNGLLAVLFDPTHAYHRLRNRLSSN